MKKLIVCTNFRANPNHPSCAARASEDILQKLQQENLDIPVEESPCMGFCDTGPNARLIPSGPYIHRIEADDLSEVIKKTKAFLKKKD